MEDDVDISHRGVGALVGPQVSLDEAHIESFEALPSASREVVENTNVVTVGQEPADEMMADEATASGDEGSPLWRTFVHLGRRG